MQKINRLTARFVDAIQKKGTYTDGDRLCLQVGIGGEAKSFLFIYVRSKRLQAAGKPRRCYFGLGGLRELGPDTAAALLAARAKAQECREMLAHGLDPEEEKDRRERETLNAPTRNATFLTMANEYILSKATDVENPWSSRTKQEAERRLRVHLKPLQPLPVREITANHVFDIIGLLRRSGRKSTAHKVRILIEQIMAWAQARGADDKRTNPASMEEESPLPILLHTRSTQPRSTALPALHFSKMPVLFAQLNCSPVRDYYTMAEAARASEYGREYLYNQIRNGRLIATKPETAVFPNSKQHWLIEPVELAKFCQQHGRKLAEVIPGLRSVAVFILRYQILCASRPGEVLGMRWPEYHEADKIWQVPWRRLKMGWKTRQDHYVPLNEPAIAILDTLWEQQLRDDIYDPNGFAFGNYLTANPTSSRIGKPPAGSTVRNLLKANLDEADADKTMHGMRTAFGSWARQYGYMEADIERGLAHIKGYGETKVARIYGRDATREEPLRQLFAAWGQYLLYGKLPADMLPKRIVGIKE